MPGPIVLVNRLQIIVKTFKPAVFGLEETCAHVIGAFRQAANPTRRAIFPYDKLNEEG